MIHPLTYRRFSCRGFSIAEVLCVMVLCSLVMVMVGELTVTATNAQSLSEDNNVGYRRAAVALDGITRELRFCSGILYPKNTSLAWRKGLELNSKQGRNFYLAFRRQQLEDEGESVVAFIYDAKSKTLERRRYPNNFTPTLELLQKPSLALERKVLLEGLEQISFWSVNEDLNYGKVLLGIKLCVTPVLENYRVSQRAQNSTLPLNQQNTSRLKYRKEIQLPFTAEVRAKGV